MPACPSRRTSGRTSCPPTPAACGAPSIALRPKRRSASRPICAVWWTNQSGSPNSDGAPERPCRWSQDGRLRPPWRRMTELETLPRWQFETILPAVEDPAFARLFAETVEAVGGLVLLFAEHHVGEAPTKTIPPTQFEAVLKAYLAVRSNAYLIEAYLECMTAADSRDPSAQARLSEFQPTVAALSLLQTRLTAWVGKADIESLAEASPLAKGHLHCLRRSVERARHLMGPAEEALAAEVVMTGSIAWERLHANVTSQIVVPLVIDGEERRLPMSEVRNLAQHADRAVRQRAFVAETAGWESVRVPLAAALNSIKGEVNLLLRRRRRGAPAPAP